MYILSNIDDRNYWEFYPGRDGIIFDITAKQLKNKKNQGWLTIKEGSVVCVIQSTRKVSTFYRVTGVIESDCADSTDELGYALMGEVIAKSDDREDITRLLNKYQVSHKSLTKNKIGVGFKVADIGDGLDDLVVKVAGGIEQPISEVKKMQF